MGISVVASFRSLIRVTSKCKFVFAYGFRKTVKSWSRIFRSRPLQCFSIRTSLNVTASYRKLPNLSR